MNRVCLAALAAMLASLPQQAQAQLTAERVATGLSAPMFTTHAPGDPNTLYILERGGAIKTLNLHTGSTSATSFYNITGVSGSGEGGALGLAFHPDYATNGKFYVNITVGSPFRTVIREFTNNNGVIGSPVDILTINQPQTNHNGGWIGFNPVAGGAAANYLYIATGDGGGGNDNESGHTAGIGNAQDITNNLLGKILRIDVGSNGGGYSNPPSNPFITGDNAAGDDEIFAYGLRNPFRAAFDRLTGDLYIGDVGQGAREEIDRILGTSNGGENFGWRLREGDIATPSGGVGGNPPPGNVNPLYDYQRPVSAGTPNAAQINLYRGTTVTGGVLYRGPVQSLQGLYFFGDYNSNNFWTLDPANPDATVLNVNSQLVPTAGDVDNPVAFGEDSTGNVYIVDIADGHIFRVAGPRLTGDANNDGSVNAADYLAVEAHFGGVGIRDGYMPGDANDDGRVDGADLLFIERYFGSSLVAITPEPATIALLLIPLAVRRSRRR